MKKRILSILLTLCLVLMLVPTLAFADENYMITQNFKYGTRTYDGTDPQTSPYQFVIPAGGSLASPPSRTARPTNSWAGKKPAPGRSIRPMEKSKICKAI